MGLWQKVNKERNGATDTENNPLTALKQHSLCAGMWTRAHCEMCTNGIHPLVVKHDAIFKPSEDSDFDRLSARVLVNKKSDSLGYESCLVKVKDDKIPKHCKCENDGENDDRDLCNGHLVNLYVKSSEKGKPIDHTEIGKIYKELVDYSSPDDTSADALRVFENVLLRIGELAAEGMPRKYMSRQICYETGCGCKNH